MNQTKAYRICGLSHLSKNAKFITGMILVDFSESDPLDSYPSAADLDRTSFRVSDFFFEN